MNISTRVTSKMQEQIDATIWLINRNVSSLNDEQREYLQRTLRNLVDTCVYLERTEEPSSEQAVQEVPG